MQLTVIIPEIRGQAFDCRGCTNCCRDLVVHLTPQDRRQIDAQRWADRLEAPAYVQRGRAYVLNHAPSGACVFLLPDGRCRIHAEFGFDAKPLACRLYPFSIEREGASVRAGIRFDCPTVQKSEGRPLAGFRGELTRLSAAVAEALPGQLRGTPDIVAFSDDCPITQATLGRILAVLDRWCGQSRVPLQQRLTGLASVVATLNKVKLHRFDDERLLELITMLTDELSVGVPESTAAGPISVRRLKLFRQAAFAHGEYVGFEQMQYGFTRGMMHRFAQLRRAMLFSRGAGPVPPLACGTCSATFELIDATGPAGEGDRDAIERLITRYLQSRIVNRGGFGRAYYGWSVLAGLNATLLAMALIGWFARWQAAGEGRTNIDAADVRRAVGIVDRTASRAPELGAKSALLRLQYLADDDGLRRLIDRYHVTT